MPNWIVSDSEVEQAAPSRVKAKALLLTAELILPWVLALASRGLMRPWILPAMDDKL